VMQVMPPAGPQRASGAPPAPSATAKSPWQLNSTIKGSLKKTPSSDKRRSEMQVLGLEPCGILEGHEPPKHTTLSDTRGKGVAGTSEQAQTMSKSKRLEPCGRCQVLTAVRVALPCGRLVNLCIPCASTFARFLSKRIRDLALDRCRAAPPAASPSSAADSDMGSRERQAQSQKGGKTHNSKGGSAAPGAQGAQGAPSAEPRLESLSPHPLDMATDLLRRTLLDKETASKVLGRSGAQIPPNTGSGGLSPTFRTRKSSPRRKAFGGVEKTLARMQEAKLPAGSCQQSPVPASPTHYDMSGSPVNRDDKRAGAGGARETLRMRDTDSATSSSTLESKSRQGDERKRRSQSRDTLALGDAASRGSSDQERAAAAQLAAAGIGSPTYRNHGWEREQGILLPHGRSVFQTNLSDSRVHTLLPDLKGALSDVASQANSPGHFTRKNSNDQLLGSASPSLQQSPSAANSGKESAVWRERGSLHAAVRGAQSVYFDGAITSTDIKDMKASAKMSSCAKQIRQQIMDNLRSKKGGALSVGAMGQHSWNNGKKGGVGADNLQVSLKTALNSII
jgi:hypothetical protein